MKTLSNNVVADKGCKNSDIKVLLIMPDYERKYYEMSAGLMYVSSYLKQKGYDVHCLNMNHYKPSKLIETLQENSFDVIGTGGLYVHFSIIKSLIKTIRRYSPDARIITGGGIASTDFEFVLNSLQPDALIVGEGERTTDLLLQTINQNGDLRQVTGIAFKEDDRVVRTESTPLIDNLDDLPLPDYEGFEYGYYLDNFSKDDQTLQKIMDVSNPRVAGIISSRDCVRECTFCFRIMAGESHKVSYRSHSMGYFLNHIKYLIDNYRVNRLNIMDDMFSANKKRVLEFCEMIKPLGVEWDCQLRVKVVDDELVARMKESGCYLISYGFESGSQAVLESMKKGIKPVDIERAIDITLRQKVVIQGNFIFGDPAETLDTMEETFKFTRKYMALHIGYGWIIPYPGSQLYHKLISAGKITDKDFFYKNSMEPINMTSLSDIDYKFLLRRVALNRLERNRFARGKIKNLKRLKGNIYMFTVCCQHCGKENSATLSIDFENLEGNALVCGNCYQRILINLLDLRFFKVRNLLRHLRYILILKLITLNPMIHYFLSVAAAKTNANRIIRKFRVQW